MPSKDQIKDFLHDVRKTQDTRLANHSKAGLMSAADKVKLDNIQFDFESGTLRFFTSKGILTFTGVKSS